MKVCPYCGATFSEEMTACPVDANCLIALPPPIMHKPVLRPEYSRGALAVVKRIGLPRNNGPVLAVAVGGWLLSWVILLGAGDVPDRLVCLWIGLKAAAPIIAAFVMYRIALREAGARSRSIFAVHLTYILILLLFAPLSVEGFAFMLTKPEAPGGIVQDGICVLQLLIGGAVFWIIRGGEFLVRMMYKRSQA